MRGIVATCIHNGTNNSIQVSPMLDPFFLRQYLLYWDKIDYPTNNLLYIGLTPEEKYLEEIGLLQRTHLNIIPDSSGITLNPEIFLKSQLYALEKNNQNNNEIWSLGQNTSKLFLPADRRIQTDTLQVNLMNCLPVPAPDTAFDDILSFKTKRQDELIEFRNLLDKIYDDIYSSDYPELTQKRNIEKLQQKLVEINRVMNESKIKGILSNMSVELNISQILNSVAKFHICYNLGEKFGFPEIGAGIGFLASAIEIKYQKSLRAKSLPDNLKDYAYLFHAQTELF